MDYLSLFSSVTIYFTFLSLCLGIYTFFSCCISLAMCSFLLSPWELHSDVYSLHTDITLPLDCCLHGFFSSFSIQPIAQVYLKWDFLDNKYLNCVVLFTWIIQVMKQCILESIFYYIFCAIISILWFNFALFFSVAMDYFLFFFFVLHFSVLYSSFTES